MTFLPEKKLVHRFRRSLKIQIFPAFVAYKEELIVFFFLIRFASACVVSTRCNKPELELCSAVNNVTDGDISQ